MADQSAENPQESSKKELDLTALSGLDFGPSWADGQGDSRKLAKKYDSAGDGRQRGKGSGRRAPSSRDRRAGGRPQRTPVGDGGDRSRGGPRRERGDRGGRGGPRREHKPFEPVVNVDLYPQDEAFDALVKRLTATARTYQLFEIAHLLLEKPERFVAVISNKKQAGEAEAAPLFFAVPGHIPFENEEDAINHVLTNHLDLFFEIEEIEVEAPKGSFQVVNRCGVTGELLGPPNYHRYQEFVQRHYSNRIHGMSFDRFQSKIESVKEQETIDAWVEAMKKGARYTLKERAEGEPESFESLEAVRHFLLSHRKDQVVGSGTSVRFAGRDVERMPRGVLRRSIETYVEAQQRFPLDTANNIRGRLRRHKFTVYKKGGKGISYVCAVKRKFRDSSTVFSDSIQALIEFLEKHPDLPATDLPKVYLGIDQQASADTPEKLAMAEESAQGAAATEAPAAEEGAETVEAKEAAVPNPDAMSAEDHAKLEALMIDLRWLITEGYVTEYGDGRLFAPAPMPEPKKKVEQAPVAEPEVAPASEAEPVVNEEPVAAATEPSDSGAPITAEPIASDAEADEPKAE
ncbi:hypothetical protein [Coraliomargarita akajimensis]|nr:hypothetical protein [Coraliomargarita akajimensis]